MSIKISGYGLTKFGELYGSSLPELMLQGVTEALTKAKLKIDDIDQVFIASMISGEVDKQSHLGSLFAEFFKTNIPALRIEAACASGGAAIHAAKQAIRSGESKRVLVLGIEKMTDHESSYIGQLLMQAASKEERDAGLSFPGLYAIMTQSYMNEYGLTRDDLSLVPSKMHENACGNPKAQFRNSVSPEQVTASSPVAKPLNLLDCSPITDGAAAVILESSEDKQGIILEETVLVTDTPGLAQRESLNSIKATKLAAAELFQKTNKTPQDIDIAEVHDCFSIAFLMALDDIGFTKPGQAIEHVKSGQTKPEINPSGGLKACGHPVGATGVKQVADIAEKLENSDHSIGLTHNIGGTGGTCVMTLITKN